VGGRVQVSLPLPAMAGVAHTADNLPD
jgi:hypothetical protein